MSTTIIWGMPQSITKMFKRCVPRATQNVKWHGDGGPSVQRTKISWCDFSWNPVRGCSRISPGCMNCYAELDMARKNSNPKVPGCHGYAEFRIVGDRREAHWTGKVELIESKLLEPLSWRKKALKFAVCHGRKPRVFVSMSDLFHERLPDEAIDRIMAVAVLCPEMNFLFLTKRADRMEGYFGPCEEIDGMTRDVFVEGQAQSIYERMTGKDPSMWLAVHWPLPNVWLGVSVEDQKRADKRIPHLLRTPATVRFLSVEPMLEQIDLGDAFASIDFGNGPVQIKQSAVGIEWVICGGESGAHARPFDLAWARSLRDQCKAAGVAFFMKQAGSLPHDGERVLYGVGPYGPAKEGLEPVWLQFKDKKGGDPAEWPDELRIQEVPE